MKKQGYPGITIVGLHRNLGALLGYGYGRGTRLVGFMGYRYGAAMTAIRVQKDDDGVDYTSHSLPQEE